MIRGTTPNIIFNTDTDLSSADEVYVTLRQGSVNIIEKTKADLEITRESVTLVLTQQETLMLNAGQVVKMQIRAKFGNGSAIASGIMTTTVDNILKDGEI